MDICLSPHASKSLNSIERIQLRMMCTSFNSNSCIIIISCYGPTDTSDKMNILTSYIELSSLFWHIPKHNVLIINGDMNAHINKDENNKYCLHNFPNRNGEYLADFSVENRQPSLNTKFYKKKDTKLWICTNPNNSF